MPTYDYECEACGHKFELFQSINAPHEKNCPSCKKDALRRLIGTGAAVMFKGSGFYQTDYRSEGYKKSAAADSKSTDSSSKSSDSGSAASTPAPSTPSTSSSAGSSGSSGSTGSGSSTSKSD